MTEEMLQQVSRGRYSSRFGAVTGDFRHVQTGIAATSGPSSNLGVSLKLE